MIKHGPSIISGPVSRTKKQWNSGKKNKNARKRRPSDAPIRQELVDRIRKEIAQGKYDTDEKLQKALERLMEENGLV
ncbi:MAG: hypothetical protein EXR99_16520 [Gemmataceae bacterium]|nr:hypothetical protein [Gemmataceae bacterium]